MLQDIRNGKAPLGGGAFEQTIPRRSFNSSKKLPPFGRDLFFQLSQGNKPANCAWIACGVKAWDRVKHDSKRSDSVALCLPFGDDPTAYYWPVSGLSCVVNHTGGLNAATLKTLGTELIKAGADRAVILDVEGAFDSYAVYFRPTECAA